MPYKILQATIEYKNGQLIRVSVLTDFTSSQSTPLSDVRAHVATNKPAGPYKVILPDQQISNDLLQQVAATGMETADRDKIFPKWKSKLKA